MLYQLSYMAKSGMYVYGIAIAVVLAIHFFVTVSVNNSNITMGIEGVAFVHFLIVGISGIREDLRFFIQHGLSRRTTYLSHLYSSLICSVALALFCLLFNFVTGNLLGFNSNSVSGIWSFLVGWVSHVAVFFFAWQLGALISTIYYRLGKIQQVVFTVAVVALGIYVLTNSVIFIVGEETNIIQRIIESAPTLLAPIIWVVLLLGIIAATGNFLLLRRVQIKD